MANSVPFPPPGFDALSVDEQLEYVQSLWDRIAATPEQVPIPEWHREILDERLKDDESNPDAGESWDVVRERLREKLRDMSAIFSDRACAAPLFAWTPEAVAEDEAAYEPTHTAMEIPVELVPEVRELLAKKRAAGLRLFSALAEPSSPEHVPEVPMTTR